MPSTRITGVRFDLFRCHSLTVKNPGMLRCVKHTRGLVKESIVTTSGAASVKPGPSLAVTAGFGGATTSTTRGLALDLAPVRVNCITPGLVDTELWSVSDLVGAPSLHLPRLP